MEVRLSRRQVILMLVQVVEPLVEATILGMVLELAIKNTQRRENKQKQMATISNPNRRGSQSALETGKRQRECARQRNLIRERETALRAWNSSGRWGSPNPGKKNRPYLEERKDWVQRSLPQTIAVRALLERNVMCAK